MIQALDFSLPEDAKTMDYFWDREGKHFIQFLGDLGTKLQHMGKPALVEASKVVFASSLREYASWIADSQPRKPTNWAQPENFRLSDNCKDCLTLKQFMESATMTTTNFVANAKIRKHIEWSVERAYVQTSTIQTARCHTLVVTKTDRRYEEARSQWPSRLQQFKKSLQPLHSAFFEQLLGSDEYERVVLLQSSTAPGDPLRSIDANSRSMQGQSSRPAGAVGQPLPPPSKKRKIQHIDLISDDD
jgi:hypothetical protein